MDTKPDYYADLRYQQILIDSPPAEIWRIVASISPNLGKCRTRSNAKTTGASGNSAPCHLHRTVAQFRQKAAGPDLLAKISLVLAYRTVPHNQDRLRRSEQEFPDRVCSSWRFNRPEPAPPVTLVAGEMWVIDTLLTISLRGILNTGVESHFWPREHSVHDQA
jgi:hypothetical protein